VLEIKKKRCPLCYSICHNRDLWNSKLLLSLSLALRMIQSLVLTFTYKDKMPDPNGGSFIKESIVIFIVLEA
jgi:hypothetical protein